MDKVQKQREMTEQDILRKLKKYGSCASIRPCHFGKTYGAVKLATENYNHILYLYPSDTIRDMVIEQIVDYFHLSEEDFKKAIKKKRILKFDFMSYMKLIKLSEEEMVEMDYDLIIFDEAHKLGARCTSEAVKMLRNSLPEAHFLGMTATPERTDAIDIIERFFDNTLVYPYTLHDAINDGVILKPYYVYSTYNQVDQIKEEILEEWRKKSWKTTSKDIQVLDKQVVEIANLYNLPNIIKGVCEEAKIGDYVKFICFFNNFAHLKEKKSDVISWFSQAFPNYSMNTITITSETTETQNNEKKLRELVYKSKHVDLIFSINMLNFGYHVESLSGILMYRCTNSNIIYNQQLGRSLFNKKHGIVIDVVNNIGRKALYDNYVRNEEISYKKRVKTEQIINGTYEDTYTIKDNEGNEIEISKDYYYDKDTGTIMKKWTRHCNSLSEQDYLLTGVEASRKQLEQKVIAESFVQVAHKVLLNYFKLWCTEVVHIPFPISFKQMQEAYGYKREQFIEWFDGILKIENIEFPYHTLKSLTNGDELFSNVCKTFSRTNKVDMNEVYAYYN